MTAPEYHKWLGTLTIEQRTAVQQAVGIVMDSLLMLEGRMSATEAESKTMNELIKAQGKRITVLENRISVMLSC